MEIDGGRLVGIIKQNAKKRKTKAGKNSYQNSTNLCPCPRFAGG